MKVLEYIFYLGIVFIVFNLLWSLIMGLMFLLAGGERKGKVEEHLLKGVNYYLLVSLTILEYNHNHDTTTMYGFATIGFAVLYLYLVGKLQQRKLAIMINQQFQKMTPQVNPKVEQLFIAAALALFIVGVFLPQIASNPVTLWFFESIKSIYNTAVIGWIIKIIGFFFMINMIFRGIAFTRKVINGVLGKEEPENKNPFEQAGSPFGFQQQQQQQEQQHDYDGEFVDFEIIEDDEDDANSSKD